MGNGGNLFPLELPLPFLYFTKLSRIHFKQLSFLLQMQLLLLYTYLLTQQASQIPLLI